MMVLAVGVAALAITMRAGQTPAGQSVAITHDVMVPMRDGVRLATDIYFPAGLDLLRRS